MLQGSLGLKMQVHDDLDPSDIHIAVPQHLYRFPERWNDLLSFMLKEGYVLTDLHEHFFQKGEIGVNFAAIDFEDSLHITETQDLIDWMKSTITISNYSESDFDKLYDYFENIRIKQGSIDIPKESGLFVSTK